MPRPGPRPYECVRRAWHSDRHQPIRGSLIQEIFRVVSEIHSPATRRNMEWQEKLPVVVLKVKEIMYSKADSEAEYMDLNTLWDRANDAINTIIRLDDTTETGDFLHPCIEAALHLGCVPRRASRSHRNNDPRSYLSLNPQEPTPVPSNLKNSSGFPPCMSMYADLFKHVALPAPDTAPENICIKKSLFPFPQQTKSSSLSIASETCPSSVQGHSAYPLYYGSCSDGPRQRCSDFTAVSLSKDTHELIGKISPTCYMDTPPHRTRPTNIGHIPKQSPPQIGCDLSLRLGPCQRSQGILNKTGHQNEELTRKRMAPAPYMAEEIPFLLQQPKLARNHFTQAMRNSGW